jgi:hypothetical protein
LIQIFVSPKLLPLLGQITKSETSMKILSVYHQDASNAGDLASSPLKYFSYTCESQDFGAADTNDMPSAEGLIVGGGGLICNDTFEEVINNALTNIDGPKILWGAGFNLHSYPFRFTRKLDGLAGIKAEIRGILTRRGLREKSSWLKALLKDAEIYPEIDYRYDLVGVRDWGTNYRWVPCASCMHPIFDWGRNQPTNKRMVIIDHPMFFSINTRSQHKESNLNKSFEDIVSILSGAEVILTSSYHAAYWGVLLGRRVVVVPWSTKFLRFRWRVEFAYDLDGVRSAIRKATSFPNALKEAREANTSFALDVAKLLSVKVSW